MLRELKVVICSKCIKSTWDYSKNILTRTLDKELYEYFKLLFSTWLVDNLWMTRLLMTAVACDMGIFEGYLDRRLFSHNIDLLRRQHYKLAGELVAWSVANGGPGLCCISKHLCNLMMGNDIQNNQGDDILESIVNEEYHDIVAKVIFLNYSRKWITYGFKFSWLEFVCPCEEYFGGHVIHAKVINEPSSKLVIESM